MATFRSVACLTLLLLPLPCSGADALPPGAIAEFGSDRFLQYAAPMTFSADGKTLVGFTGDEIRSWDAGDGKLLRRQRIPISGAPWKTISRDGKWAAFIGEPREHYVVWDVAAGKELRRLKIEAPWSFHDAVFVGDGKYLVTAQNDSRSGKGIVRLWTLADGTCQIVAEEPFYFQRFAVSPDGKRFAASSPSPKQQTRCWDTATAKALWTDEYAAVFLTFTSDNATLVGAPFKNVKEWRAWDAATGKPADVRLPNEGVNTSENTMLLSTGPLLLVSTYGGILVWDLTKGKEARRVASVRYLSAVAPDGESVLTLGPRWQRWDLDTGKPQYPDTAKFGHLPIDRIRISPDGKIVAAVGGHGHLALWDIKTGQMSAPASPEQTGFVYGLAFMPNGKQIVSAGWSGYSGGFVLVRDLPDGTIAKRFAVAHVPNALAISPDAKSAVVSSWKSASSSLEKEQSFFITHDLATGREAAKKETGERYAVTVLSRDGRRAVVLGAAFDIPRGVLGHKVIPDDDYLWLSAPTALSPDGRYYAIYALPKLQPETPRPSLVVVLEVASARPVAVLKTGAVGQIAFTPDQRRLVTADWEGLRLWDLATEECLLHHQAHDLWDFYSKSIVDVAVNKRQLSPGHAVFAGALDISPDARLAATGHPDTRIFLWDLTKCKEPAAVPAPGESAWADLLGGGAAAAYRAAGRLIAHPKSTLELFKDKLRPAAPPEPATIRRLIDQLDDPTFRAREHAQIQLAGLGPVVLPQIREALQKQPSAEQYKRLEVLVEKFRTPVPVQGEDLRGVRAVEVLERIGSAEARRLLQMLGRGAESAASTVEARAALERLGEKP